MKLNINAPKWIKMDFKWIKMDQNGSKWIKMDQNGFKWIKKMGQKWKDQDKKSF